MRQYLNLLQYVMDNGVDRDDRTGVGTRGVFGYQMRFDLSDGFPLLTTKKVHLKSVIHELLWFISGNTNISYLNQNGVTIWDEWADENGDLGPIYSAQWRMFGSYDQYGSTAKLGEGVDQISEVIESIRTNPYSRRHIVTAWNPLELYAMRLPPCHCLFQFHVANGRLSCQLYQRSADIFLGIPFNIASYALLTMMVARQTGYEPGEFIHTLGDAHIYHNHFDQVREQLSREPRVLPMMQIADDVQSIFDYKYEDFKLIGYDPLPAIKAEVAV